ncbi:MAG TPA: hypothetical protein DCE08_05905, partial [Ruminococcaceae bacterium]|nr:hypothetical protein [Oscillospiraceae bacterium]
RKATVDALHCKKIAPGKKQKKNRTIEQEKKVTEKRNPRRLRSEGGGDVFLFRCCKGVRERIPKMI